MIKRALNYEAIFRSVESDYIGERTGALVITVKYPYSLGVILSSEAPSSSDAIHKLRRDNLTTKTERGSRICPQNSN